MSSLSSSSSSSSSYASSELSETSRYLPLRKRKEEEPKKNWMKIGAIVAIVIGALIAALAVICFMNIFPKTLLGGPLGTGITFMVGIGIAVPAALVAYKYWHSPTGKRES
jgi:hypothetical protein